MSRCACFVSAPTLRFLRTIEQLASLPAADRRKIAAGILAEIKPHLTSNEADALAVAARSWQDERWRLVSSAVKDITDTRFAIVVVTEQWLLGRREVARAVSPVGEILAEKRCAAIERFIMDNISLDSFEVVELFPGETQPRVRPGAAAA